MIILKTEMSVLLRQGDDSKASSPDQDASEVRYFRHFQLRGGCGMEPGQDGEIIPLSWFGNASLLERGVGLSAETAPPMTQTWTSSR